MTAIPGRPGAAGEVELRVRAEGWRTPELEPVEIADGEIVTDYEIRLERGNSISGVVRWPDGSRERFGPLDADTRVTLERGAGSPVE